MRTDKITIQGGAQVELSKIVLGTAEYGSATPAALALELLDKYYEAGGRTLDTAREYLDFLPFGGSQSERTIGRWLRSNGVRDKMTIITKGACAETRRVPIPRVEPKCIENDILTSLAVMGIDYTDGFLLHKDDESVPVPEIMDCLDEIVRAGYARFIGASNWKAARINEANSYAIKAGKTPFSISEVYWNMAKAVPGCTGAPDNLPMDDTEYAGYLENGLPVLAYSSQAVGFFAKYIKKENMTQPRTKSLLTEENIGRAERCRQICKKYDTTPTAVCLAYISCNRVQGFPIFGSTKLAQFEESIKAFELEITQKDIEFIING